MPNADSYVVQIWDRVLFGIYDWKDLPTDKYTFSRGGSSGMIGNLNFDHTYDFRIIPVRNSKRQTPTGRIKIETAPPFYGRQEDHIMQYSFGGQQGVPSVLTEAFKLGIDAWNNSSAASDPGITLCENGKTCPSYSPSNPNDGRIVYIKQGDGWTCEEAKACYRPNSGSMTDNDGYLNGGTIYIEHPASEGYYRKVFFEWTNDPSLNLDKISDKPPKYYEYLPDTVMHEIGHGLGLYDLYNAGWFGGYRNSVMRSHHDQTPQSLPHDDVLYIREVYHNHTAK